MTRQIKDVREPENPAALRTSANALCDDLEREIARFDGGTAIERELKQVYESKYQPQTVSVMESFMFYAPADWGFTNSIVGGKRIFGSPDYDSACDLPEHGAGIHLRTIVHAIKDLVSRLPQT